MSAKRNSLALAAIEGELLPEEQTYQAKLRAAIYDGVGEDDVKQIVQQITAKAKTGDPSATKMFFDYVLGAKTKPTQIVVNNTFADVEQAARITKKAAG